MKRLPKAYSILAALLGLVAGVHVLSGCVGPNPDLEDGGPVQDGGTTADGGAVSDGGLTCRGNNDGVIERGELAFLVGFTARYQVSGGSGETAVELQGATGSDGKPLWDFSSLTGQKVSLGPECVADKWFAAHFPGASYAVITDQAKDILGIFKVSDSELQLMGFASRADGQTRLVYDQPVTLLKFPMRLGDHWIASANVNNGLYDGVPVASHDVYDVHIDKLGTVRLPFLDFQNSLRIRIRLTQTFPMGPGRTTVQVQFYHECYGEVLWLLSKENESNDDFSRAAAFRRLSL